MPFAGRFQCGPCPVKAVREGDVYLPYDSKFVYAEVNADRVYWLVRKVNGKDKYFKIATQTQDIGKKISTKAVGENRREDITREYKYPEGNSPRPLTQCQRGDPHQAGHPTACAVSRSSCSGKLSVKAWRPSGGSTAPGHPHARSDTYRLHFGDTSKLAVCERNWLSDEPSRQADLCFISSFFSFLSFHSPNHIGKKKKSHISSPQFSRSSHVVLDC